jgi:hypothetical protein
MVMGIENNGPLYLNIADSEDVLLSCVKDEYSGYLLLNKDEQLATSSMNPMAFSRTAEELLKNIQYLRDMCQYAAEDLIIHRVRISTPSVDIRSKGIPVDAMFLPQDLNN